MVEGFSGRYPPNAERQDRGRASAVGRRTRRLGGLRRVVRSRAVRLVTILIVSGGLIFAGSSRLPKSYSSVAWIRVANSIAETKGTTVDLAKDQRAAVQAFVAPRLTADLKHRFGSRMDEVSSLVATGIVASPLIRIDSEASAASLATQVADRAAVFVVNDLQNQARAKAAANAKIEIASLAGLTAKIDDLAAQLTPVLALNPSYPALKARLDAATVNYRDASAAAAADGLQARVADGGLEVYEGATRAKAPNFPNPVSWVITGDLAILLVGVGVLYGREELVGRFLSGGASESRRSGATVLGVLPTPTGVFPSGTAPGAGTTPDEIGLQLVHLLGRAGPRIVLISDAVGGAPQATASRVAQAVAQSGVRVVFAVCRSISTREDHDDTQPPCFPKPSSPDGPLDHDERMLVLDHGIAVNELTAARAQSVLRGLLNFGDYIVLAAPSPNVEPGALVLTQIADVSILVAHRGVTRLRDAERAATRLRRVGGNLLGVLVDSPAPANQSSAR